MLHQRRSKGITLISLVITIIVLLILAGVVISLTIGENGILKNSTNAKEKTSEAEARQKLEFVLLELQMDKELEESYNENQYINDKILKNEMVIIGDIVSVDRWQFIIDRSVPKIEKSLGKGTHDNMIEINANVIESDDYTSATIQIEIVYEGEILEILLSDNTLTVPEKKDGKYILTEQVIKNGEYFICAKDINEKYNYTTVTINSILPNTPVINISGNYPILTSTGISMPTETVVSITYEQDTQLQNIYSEDEGITWKEYIEPFKTVADTIKARSIYKNFQNLESKSEISVVPKDKLGKEAYDGDDNTAYYQTEKTNINSYIKVDESAYGKTIKMQAISVETSWRICIIRAIDKVGTIIDQTGYIDTAGERLDIYYKVPNDTDRICIYQQVNFKIYEITVE